MKYCILVLLLLSGQLFAQTASEIGYFVDADGSIIENYVDIDYDPNREFAKRESINPFEFSQGYYYKRGGGRMEGWVKISALHDKLVYKDSPAGKKQSIELYDVQSFVISKDSICTLSVYELLDGAQTRVFAKQLAQAGDWRYYALWSREVSMVAKNIKTGELVRLSYPALKNRKFTEACQKAFPETQWPSNAANLGTVTSADLTKVITLYRYYILKKTGGKILFNQYFQEVEGNMPFEYYATVEAAEFSSYTWSLKFYKKDGTVLYKGSYQFDLGKSGVFEWYYPNGQVRKSVSYAYGKKQPDTKIYHENGSLHYEYGDKKTNFAQVHDANGNSLLDANGNGKEVLEDLKMKRTITYVFEKWALLSASYKDSTNREVYQYCSKGARPEDWAVFQKNMKERIAYSQEALSNAEEGTAFFRLVIEPDGTLSSAELLGGISNSIDGLLRQYLFAIKRQQWLPAVANQQNVPFEMVMPVSFSLDMHTPSISYPFWQYNFQHQMFMQRMNTISVPQPPAFPVIR